MLKWSHLSGIFPLSIDNTFTKIASCSRKLFLPPQLVISDWSEQLFSPQQQDLWCSYFRFSLAFELRFEIYQETVFWQSENEPAASNINGAQRKGGRKFMKNWKNSSKVQANEKLWSFFFVFFRNLLLVFENCADKTRSEVLGNWIPSLDVVYASRFGCLWVCSWMHLKFYSVCCLGFVCLVNNEAKLFPVVRKAFPLKAFAFCANNFVVCVFREPLPWKLIPASRNLFRF